MPEGDSYTRAADRLRPVLVDRQLTYVDGTPSVRKWSGKLVGHTVTGIRTHGKHLLFDVDTGVTIHVWLGMPGRWRVRDASGRTVASSVVMYSFTWTDSSLWYKAFSITCRVI